jgi:hypothetical protein
MVAAVAIVKGAKKILEIVDMTRYRGRVLGPFYSSTGA